MLRKPTDKISDEELRQQIDFIHQEVLGKAISLDSAPTASIPLLSADEIGLYNNEIYIRIGQKIYKITPDSTITITD